MANATTHSEIDRQEKYRKHQSFNYYHWCSVFHLRICHLVERSFDPISQDSM